MDASDEQDSGGADTFLDALPDGPDGGSWHFLLDAGGTCAPKEAGAYAFKECCNGVPCQGLCVQNDNGDIGCMCGGILGGCTSPNQVCCSFSNACIDWGICNAGQ